MVLFNTNPFIASLIGWMMLGEKPQKLDLICMVVCFVGIVIMAVSKPA
jgi:drug/metabolite transporter (DMT)-like permease